jgi:hypothetical protein
MLDPAGQIHQVLNGVIDGTVGGREVKFMHAYFSFFGQLIGFIESALAVVWNGVLISPVLAAWISVKSIKP